jgi:hypothetical protein
MTANLARELAAASTDCDLRGYMRAVHMAADAGARGVVFTNLDQQAINYFLDRGYRISKTATDVTVAW